MFGRLKRLMPARMRSGIRKLLPQYWARRMFTPVANRLPRVLGFKQLAVSTHFDLAEASAHLQSYKWSDEFWTYHVTHLHRYLATIDGIASLPKGSAVLEIGGAPYGMTLLMKHYLFHDVSTVSCTVDGKERDASEP